MPLKVVKRKDRKGSLTIAGTIRLSSGQSIRIRQGAQSDNPKLATEEAAVIEAQLLRSDWHGERRGARSFATAVNAYLDAQPRSETTKWRLNRILRALGDVKLAEVDQDAVTRLRGSTLAATASPATITREVVTPLRAVLHYAHRRGWCGAPLLDAPSSPQGRTLYMVPDEVERLIVGASPHLKPLIAFLVGTGARLSEALYLDWRDVDLVGRRAIFWETKNGHRRVASLPPRTVEGLRLSNHRELRVFRTDSGEPYADRGGLGGGQIKTGWRASLRRAGLADSGFSPHTLRHTWASWHYALNKDLLLLKQDGGWSSVALVERYAHLMKEGHEDAIRDFLGLEERPVSAGLLRVV